jgi:hypothetical protein
MYAFVPPVIRTNIVIPMPPNVLIANKTKRASIVEINAEMGLISVLDIVLVKSTGLKITFQFSKMDGHFLFCSNTKTTRVNDSIHWSTRLYSRRLN